MHEDLGAADEEIQAIDNLGKAPIAVQTGSFRVQQRKPKRLRLSLVLLVSSVTALVFFTQYLRQKSGLKSVPYPRTESRTLSSEHRVAAGENEVDVLLASAKEAWLAGEYERVVKQCDKILFKEHDNARAIYIRGAAFARLGNSDLAINEFEKAVRLNRFFSTQPSSSYAEAFYEKAGNLIDQGEASLDSRDIALAMERYRSAEYYAESANRLWGSGKSANNSIAKEARGWIDRLACLPNNSKYASELHAQREWKSKAGSFSVKARFLEFSGDSARLQKANGATTCPAIDQLSIADQVWLAKARKLLQREVP